MQLFNVLGAVDVVGDGVLESVWMGRNEIPPATSDEYTEFASKTTYQWRKGIGLLYMTTCQQ